MEEAQNQGVSSPTSPWTGAVSGSTSWRRCFRPAARSSAPHLLQYLRPVSGLCADAICEGESGSSILGELASKNCFVMALDHQGHRWSPAAARGASTSPQPRACGHPTPLPRERGAMAAAAEQPRRGTSARAGCARWSFCTNLLIRGAFAELYLFAAARLQWDRTVRGCAQQPGSGRRWEAELIAAQAAVSVAIGRYDRATALLDALEGSRLDDARAAFEAFARLLVARKARI